MPTCVVLCWFYTMQQRQTHFHNQTNPYIDKGMLSAVCGILSHGNEQSEKNKSGKTTAKRMEYMESVNEVIKSICFLVYYC